MDRNGAIKLFRRDIECLSHDKCSDCILEEACDPMKTPPDSEYIEAYGMAIEALSAKPCEDAISRREVLDTLDTTDKFMDEDRTVETYKALLKECYEVLPSVTPKQKMGHWIIVDDCERFIAKCSECGRVEDSRMIKKYPYCHCGAKMEESE